MPIPICDACQGPLHESLDECPMAHELIDEDRDICRYCGEFDHEEVDCPLNQDPSNDEAPVENAVSAESGDSAEEDLHPFYQSAFDDAEEENHQ